MLALFQNNRITTVVGLIVYTAVVRAAALAGVVEPSPGTVEGEGALYAPLFGWLAGKTLASAVVAAAIVLWQGVAVNRLVDRFRLSADRSWVSGLLYIWFASCLPEFLFVTPPLIAITFLTPGLANIFRTYKQPDATQGVFDAGFWIAMAGLFYPPALWLTLAGYLGLNTMRAFSLREQAVFLIGLITPTLLTWTGYFWFDRGAEFFRLQFSAPFGLFRLPAMPTLPDVLKLALLAILLVTAIFNSGIYFYKKLINVQKAISVLYIVCLVAGLALLVRPAPRPEYALLLAPAMGIFLGMSLQSVRNRLVAELFHVVLVGVVLFIQFYPKG